MYAKETNYFENKPRVLLGPMGHWYLVFGISFREEEKLQMVRQSDENVQQNVALRW